MVAKKSPKPDCWECGEERLAQLSLKEQNAQAEQCLGYFQQQRK